MKKCPKPLGYGIRRTPVVLGLSAALCMPAAFSYANVGGRMDSESVQSVLQTHTVKGTIVDETGEPLIGVSVIVKGQATVGTITDFDGNFVLDIPTGKGMLEVSYIGYKTQTVTIGKNTQITIKMEPDTQALEEVVVIGYGAVKKRDLTGAVSSVKNEDITLTPATNPMQALQGRVAGLDITQASGQPGEGPKLQLRGTRSFTASGDPMFIIDGMPGDYSTLNPNDIESIEVLKDASSTAVYGAAGANGVIIITTKSGKAGKININLNAYVGFNGWATVPEMRSGDSYINVLREANQIAGTYSTDEALFSSPEAYKAHLNGQYIDWADELLQTGVTQNYSLSVSGGTEKTKAYFSLNFSDEQGQFTGDDYKVYSTNMRIDHEIKKWLSVGVNMQGSYVYRNKAYSRFINSLVSVPLGTVYNEDGSINVTPVPGDGNTINLLLNQDKSVYRDNNQNFKLFLNPYIEIRPFKGMTIQSRLNASLGYDKKNYFQGIGSYQYYASDGPNASGTSASVYAQIDQNRSYNYKWENIFTYNFNIKKDHEFTVTAVTSWNHNQTDKSWQKQDNIKNNSYLWHNMDGRGIVYSNYTMSKGLGLVGRINYSYLGKYLFSASVRQDGSSRLAKGNKWSTFPAVSLGWRISDEKFMQGTSNWMNNLKLRLGYGVTGAASIDPYSSVATVELDGYYSLGGQKTNSYKFSENVANADLTWERSHNWNIGLDASFFNNRIDLSADYYITNTDGVIWKQNLPVVNGAYNASKLYYMSKNIAKTQNHGLELTLNTRNIVNKEFTWTSALTFTLNNEKVKSLIGGTADHVKNEDYYLSIGYPVNSFYAPKIDGMWQLGEETDAAAFGCAPGDIKINVPGMIKEADGKFYKVGDDGQPLTDKNGDIIYYTKDNKYTYSDADSQVLGHNAPKWTMGFQNSFTYKNFDLTIYAYFRWGQMINYEMLGWYDSTGKGNFPTYFNYWTESNPSNDFPALNANRETKSYIGYGSLNYVDGSFFKIKNITLGYTFPERLLKNAGISKCRLYATITNPLTVAKSHLLKDYDPEMNGALKYPLSKQLVFGVNVSF